MRCIVRQFWFRNNLTGMMTTVALKKIRKTYPPNVTALDDIDLTIASGEFFTLLGPSGCGKTTLLRTIAGFNVQDSGAVIVGGQAVDNVPAYRRNIGMVFQDYAIFPHMSVADNVAFGLRNRRVPKHEISERVDKALAMAQLEGFGDRMPTQLSGGQQQRVGLARAMVIRPQVLLMDEPLSNLDAKLRVELREDIRALQRELGITTIYVTHDQEEALVISDRICVLEHGVVHQVGRPWEIYREPNSRFVAGFMGAMNFLRGRVTAADGSGTARLEFGAQGVDWARSSAPEGDVVIAIRPEDVILGEGLAADLAGFVLSGRVARTSFTGREMKCTIECPDDVRIDVHIANPSLDMLDQTGGERRLGLPADRLLLFNPSSGARL